jgi:hypothetical protein
LHSNAWDLAAFLRGNGADIFKPHRDISLSPGPFIFSNINISDARCYNRRPSQSKIRELYKELICQQVGVLLGSAFEIASRSNPTCRCSLDGDIPTAAISNNPLGAYDFSETRFRGKRQRFRLMMSFLNLPQIGLRRRCRSLVWAEVFERLELAHTGKMCRWSWKNEIPQQDRIEIEEEEEEIYAKIAKHNGRI